MQSEWQELPLEDCMEAIIDYRGKTPIKTDYGIPLITAKIIKNGTILPVSEFIAEDDYDLWMTRGLPKPGDVVMTTEAPLGEIAQLDHRKVALAQRVITLRGKKGLLDNTFLKYLMLSHYVQHQLDGRGTGTTVKGIKQSELRQILLKFPSYSEQKTIAHILGSLDDKIELNRQMNATLEAIAQALFKSWFVDFDPVLDNALAAGNPIPDELAHKAAAREALGDAHKPLPEDIAALFPAAFVWTEEMGWIPEGWEISLMPEATEFREGPGILAKDFHENGVPLIRLAGLKDGVSLLDGCNYLDPVKVEKKWSHFRLIEGDVLLSTSASLGRVAEVDKESEGAIPYTGIISFRPMANKTVRRFLRHYLTSFKFQEQVTMMGVGSVLNHFGPTHIKKMYMLMPGFSVQKHFSVLVSPQDLSNTERLKQSNFLAKLRDTLLPKLLSGELRIPDAEKLVEETQP